MTSELKQVVLVRRDLKLRRAALAALTARASVRFFIDSDVSEVDGTMTIHMSHQESGWAQSGGPKIIVLGTSSEAALRSLVFRAEAAGLSCHPVFGRPSDPDDREGDLQMLCASLGPDESSKIDEITRNLKLL